MKKIPLSPKLSQRYRTGGHDELAHILREVQALAALDHCNVVRYHATWIEEPTTPAWGSALAGSQRTSYRGQKLLQAKPANTDEVSHRLPPPLREPFASENGFDPFERSNLPVAAETGLEWSLQPSDKQILSTDGDGNTTDIFSDGRSQDHARRDSHIEDSSVYVLHVQMSMYPMTLAQYLTPHTSPSGKRNSSSSTTRHCFHLVPALRILLSILCGLQYIHAKHLVHRDMKPSNIFISTMDYTSHALNAEGFTDVGRCSHCFSQTSRYVNPRIGDFGLVADLQHSALGTAEESGHESDRSQGNGEKLVGTAYYRPPKMAHDEKSKGKDSSSRLDEKLDVFALGVIFLELLLSCGTKMERMGMLVGCQNGQIPHALRKKLEDENYGSGVAELVEICCRNMIEPDAARRWTCAEVKGAAEDILSRCRE